MHRRTMPASLALATARADDAVQGCPGRPLKLAVPHAPGGSASRPSDLTWAWRERGLIVE